MHRPFSMSTARLAAVSLLAGAATTLAAANVVVNTWTSPMNFHHKRVGVPDQDQKRVGLPNQGACYCAPTSFLNVMMYVSNHGYSAVAPGPGDYSGYEHYYEVTDLLDTLGAAASISPGGDDPNDPDCNGDSEGGGGGDGVCGSLPCGGSFQNVLNAFTSLGYLGSAWDDLVFTAKFLDPLAPSVSFNNLAALGVDGNVLAFCYGRYSPVGSTQGITIYRRTSGHCVTMNQIKRDGGTMELWSRDPAQDDGDPFGPSPYVSKKYDVSTQLLLVTTDPEDEPITTWTLKVLPGLDEPHEDGVKRLVDGYIAVAPKSGVFWKDYQFIKKLPLAAPLGPMVPFSFPIPQWPIADLAQDETGVGCVALTAGTEVSVPQLVSIDPLSMVATPIADTTASRLAITRFGEMYLLSTNPPIIERRDADGMVLGMASIPGGLPRAVAADDANDRVLVLVPGSSGFGGTLVGFPRDLGVAGGVQFWPIDPSVQLGNAVRMAVSPAEGRLWMAVESTDTALGFALPRPSGGVLVPSESLGGFDQLTGIDFDDSGRMYVVQGGGVKIFERGATGGWVPGDNSAFAGIDVGTMFRVARSRTNYDPALHDRPEWWNVDPTELLEIGVTVPDCAGDLNEDDLVDASDLAIILGGWGGEGLGDLDHDGTIGASDLAILLGAWGPCP